MKRSKKTDSALAAPSRHRLSGKIIGLIVGIAMIGGGMMYVMPAWGYRLLYREQIYELYHLHLYQYPQRIAENVYWLEQALRSDFANPLNALAHIEDTREWERYRYLFTMHIYLLLTELHLTWASKYMKFNAYFYNYPWKQENIESLTRAEELMEYSLIFWDRAVEWSEKAAELPWVYLEEISNWHDEHWRIENGELDYREIVNRHIARAARVRAEFEAMDETTY